MEVQGNDEASGLSEETYPVSRDGGGISSPQNSATVQIYSDNYCALPLIKARKKEWTNGEMGRGWDGKREVGRAELSGQGGRVMVAVVLGESRAVISFNSFKGNIKLYHRHSSNNL